MRPRKPFVHGCPSLLGTGSCNNRNCTYGHDIYPCDICVSVSYSLAAYNAHMKSKTHCKKAHRAKSLKGRPISLLYCSPCDMYITTGLLSGHEKSKKHKANSNALGVPLEIDLDAEIPLEVMAQYTFCSSCQDYYRNDRWGTHIKSRRHTRGQNYTAFKVLQEEAEKDKNDVAIEGDLDFGILDPGVAKDGMMKILRIASTTPLARVSLVAIEKRSERNFHRSGLVTPFTFSIEGAANRKLSTTNDIKIKVWFKGDFIGRYQDHIEVVFEDAILQKQFIITRMAQGVVGDPSLHQQFRPRKPYVPRVRLPREPETRVVEGIQPPSFNAIPYVDRLEKAEIPKYLVSALTTSSSASSENVRNIEQAFLPRNLDGESLGQRLKVILWIEEFKMEQDLERYDMADTKLAMNRPYYHLEVPGLAEKRPSVLVGDQILVRETNSQQGHWFSGHVHFVHQYEVGLRFHSSFRWNKAQSYHIRFKLNRIPLQRQHKALNTAFTQTRILFPDSSHLPLVPIPKPNLVLYNTLLSTNHAQQQAVMSVLEAVPGSLPFVIFGPPGTGKTITIVEAIKQLVKKNQNIKILACAPSNSAADLIALRLRDMLNKDEMFRMYAPSRNRNQVPDDLEPYIYYRDNGVSRPCFSVPPMAVMKQYRVIVTTCISASIVSGIGMARGHFSHIFIDEAGQATEPEVLLSIKMMADPATNVVLSGDPKQLGPIIRSGLASRLGLEVSYLERLMERPPYELAVGYGKSIVKLVKNFRSHDAILRFPNERFYDGDLRACGFTKNINAYLGSSYLPKRTFPIVFHAVYGKDDRESTSPSFFNVDEITQVRLYIERLKADRIYNTRDEDIGVITPYHAQCQKIRKVLRGRADEVKVGSVEEFQGQERSIIIISTVRSSREYVAYDIRHTLGFVASPRRFNVAVTRARALLIIIGDPEVLGIDPLWRSFLNYIHNNGGWKGPDIPWDPSATVDKTVNYAAGIRESATLDMNEFTRRMENMTLGEMEGEDLDAGVDKPWRDME